MTAPAFGDFLRPATDHLTAATQQLATDLHARSALAAAQQAHRVVVVMSHYLHDIAPYSEYEAAARPHTDLWTRSVLDMREALQMAAGSLEQAGLGAPSAGAEASVDPLVAHLAAAATSLAAGRDLLRTHFITGADGTTAGQSEWSAAITSPPLTRAMLEEIGRWTKQLALLAARLTSAAAMDPAMPGTVLHGLGGACQWLLSAGAAFEDGQRGNPVTAAGTELLHAIPANSVPERRPPQESERVSELCQGAVDSAERLRVIARRSAAQAAWSTTVTAASWRWTAKAAAVISHLSEHMLRSLAEQPGSSAGTIPEAQLHAAAEAAARACARWRDVAASWKDLTTETRGLTAAGVAETGDLVLRLGRLASGDPRWTPSHASPIQLQTPSELAPGVARAATIVAAIHQAMDALACVAAADLDAVGTACKAERIYAPTRTLPEDYDVPRPFGNATPLTAIILLDAYEEAASTSTQAVTALDAVAITLDAPSRMLAAARAATDPSRGTTTPHPGDAQPADPVTAWPDLKGATGLRQPGPVEQAVRRLAVPDPVLVLRAAAIDKAARKLIADAEQSSSWHRTTHQAESISRPRQAARTAPRVATESFPQRPAAPPGGQQPSMQPMPSAAPRVPPTPSPGRRHR